MIAQPRIKPVPTSKPTIRPALLGPLCGALLAVALLSSPLPSAAQSSEVRELRDRVERMQRELVVLQRQVYHSGGQGGGQGGGQLAAPATGGDGVTQTQAARLELRLSQFETELRRLTGQAEELSYRVDRSYQRLDEVVARLDRLEAQALAAPSTAAAPGYPDAAQQSQQGFAPLAPADEPAVQPPLAAEQPTAPGPRTLGTIAATDLEALRSQALELQRGDESAENAPAASASQSATQTAAQTAALPGSSAKERYDYAFGLLSQANYPEAERALLAFLSQHPNDPLAGNAKYWLGETYYVRQQFKEAAVTFAEGFQQYPQSSKAPDNLLKLGKSLAALGQTEDACGTYGELGRRFPNAPSTILQQADSERQRLSCP